MQNGKTRAFIAVDIPAQVRELIIKAANDIGTEGVKVVGLDQMHITLAFLGDLGAKQIESIKNIVSSIDQRKFDVSLVGTGTFSIKSPRVIFTKIQKGAEELKMIYESMSDRLSEIVKLGERGFSPHVTIARLKGFDKGAVEVATAFISKYKDYDFGSFTCDSVRLKQSVLAQGGAVHSDLYVKELS